ncbi:spermatogenesis associated 6-like protein isoform X2 [Ambystoma mexicanum]|uniref:spermatogenesis associated 6-like protein isoform X2 n=1 Tax=Ambystoma mexicanum TaxID=8296 RepID=UPI0037E8896D
MPLKVQVELHIQAITCPGVFLQEKDDIYLSVSMLGQWKETECLPPVFPLLFHEKMKFEKIFQEAIDPATVVQLLECDMVKFELTQLTPPMGEFLAFYEENTREFLFPEPKLTPSYRGVDREVLMKTVRNFPGIAPKLEFATRTSIKELSTDVRRRSYEENKVCCRRSPSASRGRRRRSPEKSITCLRKDKHFEKATKASKSRSPSPYTRRRMCQLNKDNQQRLSQLSLGNYEFKSDIDARPPFVVRHVDKSKPVGAKTSSQLRSQSSRQPSRCNCVEAPIKRALSFDSYENSKGSEKVPMDPGELSMSEYDESSFLDSCEFLNFPDKSTPGSPEFQYTSSPSDLLRQKPLSPILRRSPLRQRLQSDQSNTWESIHDRVRSLLTSNSAKQRLLCGATNSEIEDVLKRRSISLRNTPNIG